MVTNDYADEAVWMVEYLKNQSKLPVLSEMSMGSLRMAFRYDQERRWPELTQTEEQYNDWKRSRNYIKSSHQIANHLAIRSDIEIRGEKRGKTYRHIDSRPIFTDQLIAKIIPTVLLQHNAEITWSGLFPLTLKWLKILHKSFEKYPEFLPNVNNIDPITRHIIHIKESGELEIVDGRKTIQLGLKMNIVESKPYRKEFPADLDLWTDSTYTDKWWEKSSSNIQAIIKKAGEVESGSKRGTWKHSDLPGPSGTTFHNLQTSTGEKFQMMVSTQHSYSQVEAIFSKLEAQITNHLASIEILQYSINNPKAEIRDPNLHLNIKSEIRRLRDIEDTIENLSKRVHRFRDELEAPIVD